MDEEIIILPIDICRICTNLQSNLNILTEKLEDENVLLHEALEFVSCIRIDFGDGMSRTMCVTCSKRLSDAFKFKNQVLDSYRAFYNQTSDFNFKNEDSINEKDSGINAEANSIERANELGIKLSTDAISFLLEHNNCKARNKIQPASIEENPTAEDETATIELIQMEENEPPPIENNQVDNKETHSMEVETLSLEEIHTEESEHTIKLIETEENDQYVELIETEENKYTIEIIQTEKNELPPIEKVNKTPPSPNGRTQERNLSSSDRKITKCSGIKPGTKNIKTERNKPTCHICYKILPKRSNLKDHLRLHANEKNFVCSFCQKAFVQIANYRTHLRVHTKERPYNCHLCPKSYSQAGSLKTHVRSHTNEKNYVCEICYKGFTNSSDLSKHKRIHDLSLQFACETCGHLFSQKNNLQVHERNVHFKISKK